MPLPQFGIFVPQAKSDIAAMVEAARVAESSGFDSFWVMDHLFTPLAPPVDTLESWTLLTAIACATSTIRLGQLVGCGPLRPPAIVAKMAATLDHVSGGRFDLGLGWGSVEEEFGKFGIEVGSRRDRSEQLAETIEIVRLMFTGDPFDYEGKHFQLSNAWGLPVPVQDRLPIHIGGGGRTLTMPVVAKHADWWNCVGGARKDLEELAALRGTARISAQYSVGFVHNETDRDEVAAKTARRLPAAGWGEPLLGTPAELIEQIRREQARGVESFVLRFHDRASPATLERFGREVAAPLKAAEYSAD